MRALQARLNELKLAENPARELLERLGYAYVPREDLAAERDGERDAGAPELFDTNLLCVAHCGTDAAFGSLGAPENVYASWKSTDAEFERGYGAAPEGQARLIGGLLNPRVLLDILRDYIVFQPEGGRLVKKLPRYQQYRTVTNAMERILGGRTPHERGGVVWHTQGSGKSLTMLWLATKLRRSRSV